MSNKYLGTLVRAKGFTLIEMIIVAFVIMVGLIGVYIAVQMPLIYTNNSISQLTAAYLGQEGVEIVRNIRDYNVINSSPDWLQGLANGDYRVDYDDAILSLYDGQKLNLENAGFYGYGVGTATKFDRKITLSLITDADPLTPDYLSVFVRVSWQDRGKAYQVDAQENLYQWWPPTNSL